MSLIAEFDVEKFAAAEGLTSADDIALGFSLNAVFHLKKPGECTAGGMTLAELVDGDSKMDPDKKYSEARAKIGNPAPGSVGAYMTYFDSAPTWICELVMCYQVKPLTRDNVKNYFMSCGLNIGSTNFILKFLKVASAKTERLVADDGLRASAANNKFVKNHISIASSGALIIRAASEMGNLASKVFSTEMLTKAQFASDNYWDFKAAEDVPSTAMAIAYIYLQCAGSLPDNWYQGTRAFEGFPAGLKRGYKKLFNTHIKLISDAGNYEDVGSADALIDAIPKFLLNG
jgi:hypothetical protein